MNLPFTAKQFLDVFENYNTTIFPLQIIFYLLAIVVIYAVIKEYKYSGKVILIILGFLWAWIGIVYQYLFFAEINEAAKIFATLFVIQAGIFIYAGIKGKISFDKSIKEINIIGSILLLYALIIYPMLGAYFGHSYPRNPTFGLPCPTTIFTLGILLFIKEKIPYYLIIIPIIWSMIGFSAAKTLGITEDFGLGAAGLIFIMIFYYRRRKEKVHANLA